MITRTEESTDYFAPTASVRVRLFGVCLYRKEREWPTVKIWVLGVLVYRLERMR